MAIDAIPSFTQPDVKAYSDNLDEAFPELDNKALLNFGDTMLLMHRMLALAERYFKAEGISKARFLILIHLFVHRDSDGECITDLRASYPISSATMTVVLDTLEKEEMVERVPNKKDRRKVTVKITRKGKEFMQEFIPRHHKNVAQMASCLDSDEREILPGLLHKLILGTEAFLDKE